MGTSARLGLVLTLATALACGTTPLVIDPPPTTEAMLADSPGRGLYVTDAAGAATDEARGAALVELVRTEQFDHVTLYHLGPLLRDPQGPAQLARLLQRLRLAGVRSIAAPVASQERLEKLLALVQANSAVRFDALITEFEYWNRCNAGAAAVAASEVRTGCFSSFAALVDAMRAGATRERAAGRPLRLGAYLGHPTRAELQWMAARLDFVLLDYPVRTPEEAHGAEHRRGGPLKRRLRTCAELGLEVWPIFYARGEVPMEPWLEEHGLAEAEEIFRADVASDEEFDAVHLRLGGFQYFADDGLQAHPPKKHPAPRGKGK